MQILICGNYGAGNEGDEAILAALIQTLRELVQGITITAVSGNPAQTSKRHGIGAVPMAPGGLRSFLKGINPATKNAFKNCDAVLLGGGGLLQDEEPKAMVLWGMHAWYARHYKKPLYACAQTIGPLQTFWARWCARKILSWCAGVSVRDQESLKIWPKATLTTDIVFFYTKTTSVEPAQKDRIVVNLRPWKTLSEKIIKEIAEFCRALFIEERQKILLMPFAEGRTLETKDAAILQKLAEAAGNATEMIKIEDAETILAKAKLVISMRLHPLLLSIKNNTPVIALSYTQKVSSAMAACGLLESTIPLAEITKEKLMAIYKKTHMQKVRMDNQKSLITAGRADLENFLKGLQRTQ